MEPITVQASTNDGLFTVHGAKRGTDNRGLLKADIQPISEVMVTDEFGTTMHLSRWDDEPCWVVDAVFKKNGYPVFSHGRGSRVTDTLTITDDAVVGVINECFPGVWA